MTLLGRAAWWMPHWLGRVTPRISIEGQAYFARLDAKPVPAAPAAQPVAVEKKPERVT
jgi:RND superfamily putative drug exporter